MKWIWVALIVIAGVPGAYGIIATSYDHFSIAENGKGLYWAFLAFFYFLIWFVVFIKPQIKKSG